MSFRLTIMNLENVISQCVQKFGCSCVKMRQTASFRFNLSSTIHPQQVMAASNKVLLPLVRTILNIYPLFFPLFCFALAISQGRNQARKMIHSFEKPSSQNPFSILPTTPLDHKAWSLYYLMAVKNLGSVNLPWLNLSRIWRVGWEVVYSEFSGTVTREIIYHIGSYIGHLYFRAWV